MAADLFLVASGTLVLGLGVFHSLLGEIFLVRRLLRRDNLPKLFGGDSFTKRTIRYAWHLLTLMTTAWAALLLWASTHPGGAARFVALLSAASFALGAVWGLVATRARHLSWVVLAVAAALAAAGS